MVTVILVNDKGKAYCWSTSQADALACIESVKEGATATYVNDQERRIRYLCRAFDVIEGNKKRP